MIPLTRVDIITKLETLTDLDKAATLTAMTEWATTVSETPEKIINDLESYPQYAQKS